MKGPARPRFEVGGLSQVSGILEPESPPPGSIPVASY